MEARRGGAAGDERPAAVRPAVDDLARDIEELREEFDEFRVRVDQLEAAIRSRPPQRDAGAGAGVESPAVESRATERTKHLRYAELIARIREVARTALPRGATVAVVSKGDDELLRLDGLRAWHFPQTAEGVYAGYNPADSAGAIAEVEAVRGRGAEFLMLPHTALWWLDHYKEFREYLAHRHRLVTNQRETCVIYALDEGSGGRGDSARHGVTRVDGDGLVHQVREIVRSTLPTEATVIVVSQGDDELVRLDGRPAWHFPQHSDGSHAGQSVKDGATAVGQLEALRAKGAQFMVIPRPALEWVEQCKELREHLERHYRVVVRQHHIGLIFSLERSALRTPGKDRVADGVARALGASNG